MRRRTLASLLVTLVMVQCELPFEIDPTKDQDLFQITLVNEGLTDFGGAFAVRVRWDEVTHENFDEYSIERLDLANSGATWEVIANIGNPFVTDYNDLIWDDVPYRYRIRIYDSEGNFRQSQAEIVIPAQTSVTVPSQFATIDSALGSAFIDNVDTILVLPGHYNYAITLTDSLRSVNLVSTKGADSTFIDYDEGVSGSLVTIDKGMIQGFTIQFGYAIYGSAVYADGDAIIRNCVIRSNRTTGPFGWGAGLYLTGSVRVENCLIRGNTARTAGGGIYVERNAVDVRIVNCTVYHNRSLSNLGPAGSGIHVARGHTEVRNCIVVNNSRTNIYPEASSATAALVTYSSAGSGWPDTDPSNIMGDPQFVDPDNGDFHLQPASNCIDAGDPEPAYNDPDGSRNDLGAYGGPHGNW